MLDSILRLYTELEGLSRLTGSVGTLTLLLVVIIRLLEPQTPSLLFLGSSLFGTVS